jgi:hypothetical protein
VRLRLYLRLLDILSVQSTELCDAWGGSSPNGSVRLCGLPRWHTDPHTYELLGPHDRKGPDRKLPLPFQ